MTGKPVNDEGGKKIQDSDQMVEKIKQEREHLLHQIEESQKTIARSYALIEQLDAVLANIKKE